MELCTRLIGWIHDNVKTDSFPTGMIAARQVVTHMPPGKTVTLVTSRDRLIADKPGDIGRRAQEWLERRGVKVGLFVMNPMPEGVTVLVGSGPGALGLFYRMLVVDSG